MSQGTAKLLNKHMIPLTLVFVPQQYTDHRIDRSLNLVTKTRKHLAHLKNAVFLKGQFKFPL
jgi:hypothetical protein